MIAKVFAGFALCTLGIGIQSCRGKQPVPASTKFAVEFQVSNDDGNPLAGTEIVVSKVLLGKTGGNGLLSVELSGIAGQVLPVSVTCPNGYAGPESPTNLRLTRTRGVNTKGYKATHFETICTRTARDIVLVVRAEGGAGLPLQIDGWPSGSTNADGIAHVLVRADRNVKALNVTLDTRARQDLRPRSPSRTYELAGNDAVLVFEQAFVKTARAIARSSSVRHRQHIPYRVE